MSFEIIILGKIFIIRKKFFRNLLIKFILNSKFDKYFGNSILKSENQIIFRFKS